MTVNSVQKGIFCCNLHNSFDCREEEELDQRKSSSVAPGVGSPRYPLMHASVTQLQMSCLMTYGGRWWVFWRSSYTSTGRNSSRVCLNYWMSKPVELANSTCLIIWSWVGEEHSFCILKDPISGVFSIFTPVFRNDSNMLICCSRNI